MGGVSKTFARLCAAAFAVSWFAASLFVVSGLAGAAHAQQQSDWTLVSSDAKGQRWFFRVGSPNVQGQYVTSTVEFVPGQRTRSADGKWTYDYEIDTRVDDCAARRVANIRIQLYQNNGRLMLDQSIPITTAPTLAVSAGSVSEVLQAYACQFAGGVQKLTASVSWANFGNDWQSFHTGATGTEYYLPKSIKREQGMGAVIVNQTFTADAKLHNGTPYRQAVFMAAFDCKQATFAYVASDFYDAGGALVWTYKIEPDKLKFQPVREHTADEMLAKVVCDGSTGQPGPGQEMVASGTGWLSDRGYIVTAAHVVANSRKIMVYHDGKLAGEADVERFDPANDVAVLKAKFDISKYEGLHLKTTPTPIGARVFTLGYPIPDKVGYDLRVTSGDVNAVSGYDASTGRAGDARFMQISVPVTHGNSGGPLIDESGQVVGIINSGLPADEAQNANFSLKAAYIEAMLADLPVHATRKEPKITGNLAAKTAELKDGVFYLEVEVDPPAQH